MDILTGEISNSDLVIASQIITVTQLDPKITESRLREVKVSPRATKYVKKLPSEIKKKIKQMLESLEIESKSWILKNSIKMVTYRSLYRIEVQEYRIIFEFENSNNNVLVLLVGHRREVYEQLKRMNLI